jgi:hypothetical protein
MAAAKPIKPYRTIGILLMLERRTSGFQQRCRANNDEHSMRVISNAAMGSA